MSEKRPVPQFDRYPIEEICSKCKNPLPCSMHSRDAFLEGRESEQKYDGNQIYKNNEIISFEEYDQLPDDIQNFKKEIFSLENGEIVFRFLLAEREYILRQDGTVVEGREMSSDGLRHAQVVKVGDNDQIKIDGVLQKDFVYHYGLKFSGDSNNVAYFGRRSSDAYSHEVHLIIDGEIVSEAYDAGDFVFSENGAGYAFAVPEGGDSFIVYNGVEIHEEEASELKISRDGKHLLFQHNDTLAIWLNNKEIAIEGDAIDWGFSKQGNTAYVTYTDGNEIKKATISLSEEIQEKPEPLPQTKKF